MPPRMSWLHQLAALSGASAVALGAYGAHGFRPVDPYYAEVFKRANSYHLIHSLLLAVAPLARKPVIVGGLTACGIALFSGSCYAVALYEDRKLNALAPYGGISLMLAWLALAL